MNKGKIDRSVLPDWIVEALKELGGSGTVLEIAKKIWHAHKQDLEGAGDLFYTWQYDFRWAGTELRRKNILELPDKASKKLWVLK